jgi:hypothetical protein
MQNQLESADRPWLKITGAMPAAPLFYHVPYVLTPGLDFVNTGIKVTFENVGHSVAFDVTTRAQMVLVKPLNGAENDYFEESGRKAEGGKRKEESGTVPLPQASDRYRIRGLPRLDQLRPDP